MSMIQHKVNELNSVKNELKKLRIRSSELRSISNQLEQEIDQYLESKDQPGLKYKGTAIIRETKTKRRLKNKEQQKADAITVISKYGIDTPEKVLEEIMESRRGSPEEHKKLIFKNYKKD